jgi:hypothetical protein
MEWFERNARDLFAPPSTHQPYFHAVGSKGYNDGRALEIVQNEGKCLVSDIKD